MANTIAQLAVKLGLETSDFTQGIEKAGQGLEKVAEKAKQLAVVGAAAFTAMVYKSMELSDHISDLADATGVSIAKVLQLSDALEMSGGEFGNAGKVIEKFAQNIDAAAQGSKPLQDAFARVGVTLKDLKTLSTEDLLAKATEGISKLGDKATQTGAKMDLFGKGMKGVDMNAFNEEIQKGSEEYQRYADAVAMSADMHDKMAKKTMMLSLSFTQHLMPTVVSMLDTWVQKGGLVDTAFEYLKKGLLGMWYATQVLIDAWKIAIVYWDKLTGKIDADTQAAELDKIYKNHVDFRKKIQELDKGEVPKQKDKENSPINRAVTAARDPEIDRLKAILDSASLLSKEYERQLQHQMRMLTIQGQMAYLTKDEATVQNEINKILESTNQKISDIEKQRDNALLKMKNPAQKKEIVDAYEAQIKAVRKLGDEYQITAQKEITSQIEAQRTFSFGWNKALRQYAEDSLNYSRVATDSFNSMTGNMTSALDRFVDSGKLSFSDLASSIIKDLIKIQLRMQASQLLSSMFGGMFNSGVREINQMSSTFVGPKFAAGGSIDGPSLVGENGPELFIPSRSGTIIPNNNLSSVLGGSTNVTNNYINAIDTKSFEDRLLSSHNAIWAANQYANKSLQVSGSRT